MQKVYFKILNDYLDIPDSSEGWFEMGHVFSCNHVPFENTSAIREKTEKKTGLFSLLINSTVGKQQGEPAPISTTLLLP